MYHLPTYLFIFSFLFQENKNGGLTHLALILGNVLRFCYVQTLVLYFDSSTYLFTLKVCLFYQTLVYLFHIKLYLFLEYTLGI